MEKKSCIHSRTLYSKDSIGSIPEKSEFQEMKIVIHQQNLLKRKESFAENCLSRKMELA